MRMRLDLRQLWAFVNKYRLMNLLRFSGSSPFLLGVAVFLTDRCDMKCYMCNAGITAKCGNRLEDREIDIGLLKKIIAEISSFNFIKPRIHFTGGGEPLLHSNFIAASEYCREKNAAWSVTTNGFALDRYHKHIVDNKCDHVTISVHGPEELHDNIVGVSGCFSKVISNIKLLDDYKKEKKTVFPLITMHCVMIKKNAKSLRDILRILEPLPVHSIEFLNLMFTSEELDDPESAVPRDREYTDAIKEFTRYAGMRSRNPRVLFLPYIRPEDIELYYNDFYYPFGGGCIQPWITLWIFKDGSAAICSREDTVGSVREESIKQLWNNRKSIALRNRLRKQGLTKNCQRCCFRQFY
jgi:MoaA/NifB/PqqE/SkfB family radical SAM enzyme